MHRRIIIPLLLLVVLPMLGCGKQINGLELSKFDKGTFWHDLYLTNKSGEELHEVRMKLTLTGEDGKPLSEERYYVVWSKGQTIKVSLSVENSPINVQKISLAGSCTEGRINATWVNR
jgi:hypothetical protein